MEGEQQILSGWEYHAGTEGEAPHPDNLSCPNHLGCFLRNSFPSSSPPFPAEWRSLDNLTLPHHYDANNFAQDSAHRPGNNTPSRDVKVGWNDASRNKGKYELLPDM